MNLKNKIKTVTILLLVISFSFCKGQTPTNFTNEEELQFIGTWVAEGSDADEKWVFNQNNLLYEYSNNLIDERYNWTITKSINSGVESLYLKLVNVNDSTDEYKYEISIINDERLVLIYQRGDNLGISKPLTYFKN